MSRYNNTKLVITSAKNTMIGIHQTLLYFIKNINYKCFWKQHTIIEIINIVTRMDSLSSPSVDFKCLLFSFSVLSWKLGVLPLKMPVREYNNVMYVHILIYIHC